MGYLSCRAETSISTAQTPSSPSPSPNSSKKQKPHHQNKPIKLQEFDYKDLELATNNFSDTKLLGKGSHGLVYKAILRNGRLVAVKKPSRNPKKTTSEVENEIDILSKLHSPRLVNLLGFTNQNHNQNDRLLVVEFMSNGTLYDVLHSNSNNRPPNWGRRIKLALQTAKAIDTLHSLNPPVIHRDIKSANVLIDRNFNARLGDFGLALRCVDDCRLRSTPPAGTMGYLDPCYVTPDNLSTKTDVFSFGILLLEIISGRKAIDMSNSPPSVVDWAIPLIKRGKFLAIYDPRLLPPKDAMVRKMLAVVAAKCVRSCRERRLSMKEVVECLTELHRLVPVHSWNGLGNPCLMVETGGVPSQLSRGGRDDGDVEVGRNPRRVYSDLGCRSNLMELMASPEGGAVGSKVESKRVSSFRFDGVRMTSIRSMVFGDWKDRGSNMKTIESVGEKINDDGLKNGS
ncbi:serine/threonine-protein kinase-like protein At3g51990 [Andrographis paniculata]|uniref:serine/threonine-protein kinase-like protein At3g51990 n=1 Tax=Andrographis paniculata TaxID=175694 RepID=UPI0021E96179|nr:serine/threonine-protein kinase-like protein At3g51990 [Andrographis paniculata]